MPRKADTSFDDLIIELYYDGWLFTLEEIGNRINKSPDFVRSRLKANHIPINSKRAGCKKLSNSELKKVKFLYQRMGMDSIEGARVLGISSSQFRRRMKLAKVPSRGPRGKKSPFALNGGIIE